MRLSFHFRLFISGRMMQEHTLILVLYCIYWGDLFKLLLAIKKLCSCNRMIQQPLLIWRSWVFQKLPETKSTGNIIKFIGIIYQNQINEIERTALWDNFFFNKRETALIITDSTISRIF